MNYTQRIDAARAAWAQYSPDAAPQLLVLGSCLWDIARMASHEPALLEGQELSPALLAAWQANFTRAAAYARQAFPQVRCRTAHAVAGGTLILAMCGCLVTSVNHDREPWPCIAI